MSQAELQTKPADLEEVIEEIETSHKQTRPLLELCVCLGLATLAFLFWNLFSGPVFSQYKPAKESREEIQADMPDWYDQLFDQIVSHENNAVASSPLGSHSSEIRHKKFKDPDAFLVPADWFEAVKNTPELNPDEIRVLKERAGSVEFVTTTMAAQWLIDVSARVQREQAYSAIHSQKEAINSLGR